MESSPAHTQVFCVLTCEMLTTVFLPRTSRSTRAWSTSRRRRASSSWRTASSSSPPKRSWAQTTRGELWLSLATEIIWIIIITQSKKKLVCMSKCVFFIHLRALYVVILRKSDTPPLTHTIACFDPDVQSCFRRCVIAPPAVQQWRHTNTEDSVSQTDQHYCYISESSGELTRVCVCVSQVLSSL